MQKRAKVLIVDEKAEIHDMLEKLFSSYVKTDAKPIILHADNDQSALNILGNNPDTNAVVRDLEWLGVSEFRSR